MISAYRLAPDAYTEPSRFGIQPLGRATRVQVVECQNLEGFVLVDPNSEEFLRSFAWRKLRMKALDASNGRCCCCGMGPADGLRLNVDHIRPRKTHPHLALELSNLQVLCEVCNHGKGNWSERDWRAVKGYMYNPESGRNIAHVWTGLDTACHQWSSGSLCRTRPWQVFPTSGGKRICGTCLAHVRRISQP